MTRQDDPGRRQRGLEDFMDKILYKSIPEQAEEEDHKRSYSSYVYKYLQIYIYNEFNTSQI